MSTLKYKYDHRMRKRLYSRENGTGYHNTKYNKNTIYVLIYVLYTIHEMARFGIQEAIQYTQDTAPACGKYRGISVIRIGT